MSNRIEIARETVPSIPALEAEWRALEADAGRGFFLSWAWIGTWIATLPPDVTPILLRAHLDDETVGLALAVESGPHRWMLPARTLSLNATGAPNLDTIYIEHNGFLCAPADEKMILAALAAWFADEATGINILRLPGIAEPLAPGRLLDECIEEPGFITDLAPIAASDGDVGTILSSNTRQQLRRIWRGYEQRGPLTIKEAGSADEAVAFFETLKKLHVASWDRRQRRHAFAVPAFERFHRALIEREFRHGKIQLLRISAGADAIGYLYNFRHGDTVYAYQSGFDDGDRKLSPGVASHALALRHNALQGALRYDFLAGSNRLKQSFATEEYVLYWQMLRHARIDHRLKAAMRRLKRRIAKSET
jgi:CelD/BcsL family acetyltransferase involved in cellulose biosynthesis